MHEGGQHRLHTLGAALHPRPLQCTAPCFTCAPDGSCRSCIDGWRPDPAWPGKCVAVSVGPCCPAQDRACMAMVVGHACDASAPDAWTLAYQRNERRCWSCVHGPACFIAAPKAALPPFVVCPVRQGRRLHQLLLPAVRRVRRRRHLRALHARARRWAHLPALQGRAALRRVRRGRRLRAVLRSGQHGLVWAGRQRRVPPLPGPLVCLLPNRLPHLPGLPGLAPWEHIHGRRRALPQLHTAALPGGAGICLQHS